MKLKIYSQMADIVIYTIIQFFFNLQGCAKISKTFGKNQGTFL